MRKIIIIVLALAVVSGFLFWKFAPDFTAKPAQNQPVTLTIWGLWEEEKLMTSAFDNYKKTHPNVTLKYEYQTSRNYRTRVQTKINNNQGPDIFMIHNTWLPMFLKSNSVSSAPDTVIGLGEYNSTYYPIIRDSFVKDNKIYAIARGVDGLALYYNEDILKNTGVAVPQTWNDFVNAAVKTTVKGENGVIQTAGAAMGTTGNVDHWSDIIGLLFSQQPNASLENPSTDTGVEVLRFYTEFITDPSKKVWDTNMESSTQAFAQNKLAFYFAPSWRAHELRVINPQLNFKTAPVPYLFGRNVGWGTFWGYAVSSRSANQKEAWEFLKYLGSAEAERTLFQEASKERLFGLPYSRLDMQKELSNDPIVGTFVNQAPTYTSWYLSSNTADAGVNDQIIKYYEDAINKTLLGSDPATALQTTALGIKQVLDEFNNPAPSPTANP